MKETEPHRMIAQELGVTENQTEKILELSRIIAGLEKVPLGHKQRLGLSTIGGAMRAYDSAFDNPGIGEARLNGGRILDIVRGKTEDVFNLDQSLARALALARENLNPEALRVLGRLTESQIASIQQREGIQDQTLLRGITRDKGSNTALLLALEINPDMSEARQRCFEEFGFLMQLIDDFQDKELDTRDGIITLANSVAEPQVLQELINQNKKVRQVFESQYEYYQLQEFFKYLDKLLASVGILK